MEPSDRFAITLGEAIYSLRAIRRIKPDPIPDDDLLDVLDAARQAPNGGNSQPWHFLAIKDEQLRRQFGELYREAWWAKRADQGIHGPDDIDPTNRTTLSAMKFADEIGSVPAIVLVCATEQGAGAMGSVIPAVQNMLLAARALGVGGTITTLHPSVDDRVKELLDIPQGIQIVYAIPLGYPKGNFGPVTRKPLSEICSIDNWDNKIS